MTRQAMRVIRGVGVAVANEFSHATLQLHTSSTMSALEQSEDFEQAWCDYQLAHAELREAVEKVHMVARCPLNWLGLGREERVAAALVVFEAAKAKAEAAYLAVGRSRRERP